MKLHTLSIQKRQQEIEKVTNVHLKHIKTYSLDETQASTRHCENMIGVIQVPLGVAGPLKIIHSQGEAKQYYVPLSTTEGALVASVNRGCSAITKSGGAHVLVERIGATRGPVFSVKTPQEKKMLCDYVFTHKGLFNTIAQTTSNHIVLTDTLVRTVGRYCYVRFVFDTKDAMGLNMVTIATDAIVRHIEQTLHISCLSLSGNFCVDKKPSWLNMIEGRGMRVSAEVEIPKAILSKVLKTTAQRMFDVWMAKCMMGSIMSGSMGYNAQYANVVAATFLATGQDIAHVVEGSLGITTVEVVRNNLYISIYMPDCMVGTVGGGTELATQKEALALLGIYGGDKGNNSQTFAEIIGSAVLAGEISLLASLGEKSLAQAHEKYARRKHI